MSLSFIYLFINLSDYLLVYKFIYSAIYSLIYLFNYLSLLNLLTFLFCYYNDLVIPNLNSFFESETGCQRVNY